MPDLLILSCLVSPLIWFAGVMLVRANPTDWPDRPTKEEIAQFRWRLAAALCLPQIIVGAVMFAGRDMEWVLRRGSRLSDPRDIAADLIVFLCFVALLWWLWFHGGHEYLARYAPAFHLPANAVKIRWTITGLAALWTLLGVIQVVAPSHPRGPY